MAMSEEKKNLPQQAAETDTQNQPAAQATLESGDPAASNAGEQQPSPDMPAEAAAEEGLSEDMIRNKYADAGNKKKKKLPKWARITIWVVILGALVAGGIYLVRNAQTTTTDADTSTAIVTRGYLGTYVEGSGMTSAKKQVELGKDLKGTVTDVQVSAGDYVNEGQVLFIVDPTETRKELDDAQSALDDAIRAVDEATDALNEAKKNQANLTVKAPFTGKLLPPAGEEGASGSIDLKVGQTLASGSVIGTMVDDSTMLLPLYFSYAYEDSLKVGADATVSVPETMSTVTGKVDSIEKVQKISDQGVVLFKATIRMDNPGALKKDMVATAVVSSASGDITPAEAGKLEYIREEEVTAKASGEIVQVNAEEYYGYSQGAVLCRLKEDSQANSVESAQRNLESQKKNVTSKQEVVDDLKQRVEDCTVKAPWAGIVLSLTCEVDDELEANTTPCVVADLSSIVVNAELSELDVDKVTTGMDATISMDNGEGPMDYPATVTSVSMKATMSSGGNQGGGQSVPTFPVVIQLLDGGEGSDTPSLSPDRSVEYKIVIAEKDDCLIVPSSAVVYAESGAAVFVKAVDGKTYDNQLEIPEGTTDIPEGYILVGVETGLADDTNTEILSGLEEGDEVFLAGPIDPFASEDMGGVAVAY